MPQVSFAFAQAAHIRVLFNLWVICTVAIGPRYLNTLATYIGPIYMPTLSLLHIYHISTCKTIVPLYIIVTISSYIHL